MLEGVGAWGNKIHLEAVGRREGAVCYTCVCIELHEITSYEAVARDRTQGESAPGWSGAPEKQLAVAIWSHTGAGRRGKWKQFGSRQGV
jgi:hypothetical protein